MTPTPTVDRFPENFRLQIRTDEGAAATGTNLKTDRSILLYHIVIDINLIFRTGNLLGFHFHCLEVSESFQTHFGCSIWMLEAGAYLAAAFPAEHVIGGDDSGKVDPVHIGAVSAQ